MTDIIPFTFFHIDNDSDWRDNVKIKLDSPGITLRSFVSSEQAMASDDPYKLDALIFDTTGNDFAVQLLNKNPSAKRILLSGGVVQDGVVPEGYEYTSPDEVWEKGGGDWRKKLDNLQETFRGQITNWICEIAFGQHIYPLTERAVIVYSRDTRRAELFNKENFVVSGDGPDYDSAMNNLRENFHVDFQRLTSTLRVNLTPARSQRLDLFQDVVDIDAYKGKLPLVVHAIGKVESVNPFRVRWNDCDDLSEVDLATAPAELARWKSGTWFSSHVEMDRMGGDYKRVLTVELEDPFGEPLPQDADPSCDIATMDDLPKGDWADI